MEGAGFDDEKRRQATRIFLVALALRLGFLALWTLRHPDLQYTRDPYYEYALSWLGGPARLDLEHPPVYTFFIAAVLRVSRTASPLPALIVQCALSACVPLLLWRLGRRLSREKEGRLAAWIAAVDPPLIYFAAQLGSETVFTWMLLLFFVLLHPLLRPGGSRPMSWSLLGLLGGAAGLCRSAFAGYPAFLLAALPALPRDRRPSLRALALFCACWLAPIAAWTARNRLRYGVFVPLSANAGVTLYEGLALRPEELRRRLEEMDEANVGYGAADPAAMDRRFLRKAAALAAGRPLETLRVAAAKALDFWRPWPRGVESRAAAAGLTLYFSLLLSSAALGAWAARRATRDWAPLYALFAYFTCVHAFFRTALRYRLPLEPFLCLLAAAGLLSLASSLRSRKRATPSRRWRPEG